MCVFSFKDEPTPTTSSPSGFQKKATSIPPRPTISSRKLIVPCITRSACVCTFFLASTTSWRRGWALNIHHKEVKMCDYCLACRRSFLQTIIHYRRRVLLGEEHERSKEKAQVLKHLSRPFCCKSGSTRCTRK